ncbi:FAD-binding protein [Microtetraspora sp. NBRC 16547]|uniref:FAD-binding oxidoreductase n=1 Tax=Microtetraspora sp. NBRC 16547 TaxID=3030993 RepID=UPI0024A0E637|nr:FAD-binding protein [Microtetraspora sp. NBRC 16547]GLX01001.1 hypothetical protein Misp02_50870 [Microtetraspora sp. NBRC 16547]
MASRNLLLGPRPATHDHCTIGGMLGNNSCGATAQAYGKMSDNVLGLDVLTYGGARFWAGPGGGDGMPQEMRARLRDLGERYGEEIRRRPVHLAEALDEAWRAAVPGASPGGHG